MHDLTGKARDFPPLLAAQARAAELACHPTDAVIDAVRDSGIFSLMVPGAMGGQGEDLDIFFDVVLELSRGDCSMGWVISFYIEHNFWLLHFSPEVVERVFDGADHVLAPGTLNLVWRARREGTGRLQTVRPVALGHRHSARNVGSGRCDVADQQRPDAVCVFAAS